MTARKQSVRRMTALVGGVPRLVAGQRFVRFGVVGVIGMVVNTIILWLLVRRGGLAVLPASAIATETAIISNFLFNDRWTFRATGDGAPAWQRFLRFNGVALGGMAITMALLWLLHTYTPLPLAIANIGAIGAATAWNYVVNSRWTWRGTPVVVVAAPAHDLPPRPGLRRPR